MLSNNEILREAILSDEYTWEEINDMAKTLGVDFEAVPVLKIQDVPEHRVTLHRPDLLKHFPEYVPLCEELGLIDNLEGE